MNTETYEWVQGLVTDALAGTEISDWERSYLNDQKERLEKYEDRTFFSTRQWVVIDRIAEKISHPERPAV